MKSYSSYKYSTGYDRFANNYSRYGSIFRQENPYKLNAPTLNRSLIDGVAGAYNDATRAWETYQIERDTPRSMLDRTFDALLTMNYASAGFAQGVAENVKNAPGANFATPFVRAGQGFMAGAPSFFGRGNTQHEYTYSRVLGTLGWNPESTFGKVLKGTVGFVGDVLLDPTTYATFGVSAALKGTGRVGRAAEALNDVVTKVPDMEVYNRAHSLMSKGVSEERAWAGAKRLVEKNASEYTNVTQLTPRMAEQMVRYDNLRRGTSLTDADIARDASNLAKEFNKAVGIRNYDRGITFGVRNLPFVGDKIGNKLGKFGDTKTIVDSDSIRAWSDRVGISKSYSNVRFNIYGSKFGKMLSTTSTKVDWAQKDPVALYHMMAAADATAGKNIDKIARKRELNNIAKSMNLTPSEQREIIDFMENRANRQKVRSILRVGETQAAKVYESMMREVRPSERQFYDELEGKARDIHRLTRELEQYQTQAGRYAPENLSRSADELEEMRGSVNVVNREIEALESEYASKYKEYVADLTRVDMKKVKDVELHKSLVTQLDSEIEKLVSGNAEITKSLRQLRKDFKNTQPTRAPLTREIMENTRKLEGELRAKDAELVKQIRDVGARKRQAGQVVDESVKKEIDALKAEREEIARNLRIVEQGIPEKRMYDYNPHQPNFKHATSLRTNMKSLKGMGKDLKRAKMHEITDSMSEYVFGRKGMFETITDEKLMENVMRLIEKGQSPSYIQRIPMIRNDRLLTPRASATNRLVAKQLGYKNYDRDHLDKLKKLEQKAYMNLPKDMSAGVLTDVEKGRFDFLRTQMKTSQGVPEELKKEYLGLVRKMRLQRDYEGVNPGNYNFNRLDAKEKQEYLRLKALDEQRQALIEQYTRMSDAEFAQYANVKDRGILQDDIEEMLHGVDGAWSGKIGEEKALINPNIFMDDFMREASRYASELPPSEQDEFFKRIVNGFAETKRPIPGRGTPLDEADDMSEAMLQGGRAVDSGSASGFNVSEETRTLHGAIGKHLNDKARGIKSYNAIGTAHQELISRFGGRAYDDLTAAEQKVLIKSVMGKSLNDFDADLFWKGVSMQSQKVKRELAKTTRIEEVRERVWEGHVVRVGDEMGTVMVRRDLEDGTQFDLLMGNGNTYTVNPEDITSISRHKVYDAKSVATSKSVQSALGTKRDLVNQLKQIDEQIKNVSASRQKIVNDDVYVRQVEEIEMARKRAYAEHLGKLEEFAITPVPTQKYTQLENKIRTLENTRQDNHRNLARFREQRKKEITNTIRINDEAFKERFELDMRFHTDVTRPRNEETTRLVKLRDELEGRISDFNRNVEEYVLNTNKFQDAIAHLGGEGTLRQAEEAFAKMRDIEYNMIEADTLEDFIRVKMEAEGKNFDKWSKQVMDEETGLNALLRTIDNSPLSDKQKEWAKLVRENFFRAGLDEVRIGKLTPEQFEQASSTYVFHKSTPELEAHKARLELAGHSTPTQDYGYGVKFSESSKSRTQSETIREFNELMKDTLKGANAFSDDLSDIFLTRMLKHEEIMYDDKVMNTFMERFGTPHKYGDAVKDGFQVIGNYGKIREFFVTNARTMMSEEMRAMPKGVSGRVELSEAEMRALFEKQLRKILPQYGFDDMAIMEGKTLPLIELTDMQIQKLSSTGLVYQVNDGIVQKANSARKIKMARDDNALMQAYDKFQHFIKLHQTALMPAFHIKNKYSNMFQSWLGVGRDAFNPRLQLDSAKAVLARGDAEKLKNLKPLISDDGTQVFHWNDLYDEAVHWGVIDEGYFAQDLSRMTESQGLFRNVVPGKYDPTSTRDFVAYKFATNVGGHVENSDRLLHYASLRKQGKSIDDAADSSIKYLFDYSDLTEFERMYMKRLLPYYTWLRKNSRLQVSEIIEQPEKYAMAAKVMNGMEGGVSEEDRVDRTYLPGFAQDWIQTPFHTTNGAGQRVPVMLSPNMPFMDISRLPDIFNPTDSAREYFSMSSPIFKVPLELATNYNSFFNANVVDEESERHPSAQRLLHAAKQLGWVGVANNLATTSGSTNDFHILNTLSGVKLMNHNEIYARQMYMKGLYEGNSDLGRAANEFTEEIRTRMANRVYLYQGAVSEMLQDGVVRLTGMPPTHPEDYTGALAPISRDTYNELSADEKRLYTPPTKDDVSVYNKEAQRLSDEAYRETGIMKKFVWSLFDGLDGTADKDVVRVERVADGDTFTVSNGSMSYPARLLMVDTPETVDPDMQGAMPYGQEASDFTSSMLLGKDVTLVSGGRDRYGRTLVYVELEGDDFNRMLLEEGLGKLRYLDGTRDYGRLQDYKSAELDASQAGTGLWGRKGYARPGIDEGFNWGE